MAPEQLSAFLGPDRWESVGASADIYSLGLVLRELIIGEPPKAPEGGLPLREAIQSLLDERPSLRADLRPGRRGRLTSEAVVDRGSNAPPTATRRPGPRRRPPAAAP